MAHGKHNPRTGRKFGLNAIRIGQAESRVPLSKGERKKRLEYDASVAKTVLAIVGVALVALLLWLDYKGY